MNLRQRLEQDSLRHAAAVASTIPADRCVSCGTKGTTPLDTRIFTWRRQVSRSDHEAVRVEHQTAHLLCNACLSQLTARRRLFWRVRYCGGIALGIGLCGVVAGPAILLLMHLTPSEKSATTGVITSSVLALIVAWIALRYCRRLSVPGTLVPFTRDAWECVAVGSAADAAVASSA